jgi:hypothetical protein
MNRTEPRKQQRSAAGLLSARSAASSSEAETKPCELAWTLPKQLKQPPERSDWRRFQQPIGSGQQH